MKLLVSLALVVFFLPTGVRAGSISLELATYQCGMVTGSGPTISVDSTGDPHCGASGTASATLFSLSNSLLTTNREIDAIDSLSGVLGILSPQLGKPATLTVLLSYSGGYNVGSLTSDRPTATDNFYLGLSVGDKSAVFKNPNAVCGPSLSDTQCSEITGGPSYGSTRATTGSFSDTLSVTVNTVIGAQLAYNLSNDLVINGQSTNAHLNASLLGFQITDPTNGQSLNSAASVYFISNSNATGGPFGAGTEGVDYFPFPELALPSPQGVPEPILWPFAGAFILLVHQFRRRKHKGHIGAAVRK